MGVVLRSGLFSDEHPLGSNFRCGAGGTEPSRTLNPPVLPLSSLNSRNTAMQLGGLRRVTAPRSPKKRLPRQSVTAPGQQQPADDPAAAILASGGALSGTSDELYQGGVSSVSSDLQACPAAPGGLVDCAAVAAAALVTSSSGDLAGLDGATAPDIPQQSDAATAALQEIEAAAAPDPTPSGKDGGQAAAMLTMAHTTDGEASAQASRGDAGSARESVDPSYEAERESAADVQNGAHTSEAMAGEAIASGGVGADDFAASGEQQDVDPGAVIGVLDGIMDAVEVAANRWAAPSRKAVRSDLVTWPKHCIQQNLDVVSNNKLS